MRVTAARAPLLFLARILAVLARDLVAAAGALIQAIGVLCLRLALGATAGLVVLAPLLRLTGDVTVPGIVWLALAGAWLAATLACVLGWLLRCAAQPERHARAGRRRRPVSAQRIQEWDAAWRRVLHYQQQARQQAQWTDEHSTHRHGRAGDPMPGSLYEILGIDPHASQEQIRAAYRDLAKRMHPDSNPGFIREATERFRDIQHAYDVLSDPAQRAVYDRRSTALA
jgi:DnaJ-domain-containing protein 1